MGLSGNHLQNIDLPGGQNYEEAMDAFFSRTC